MVALAELTHKVNCLLRKGMSDDALCSSCVVTVVVVELGRYTKLTS